MSFVQANRPVRIAHVIGKLSAGGVESVINNYYRHIDHERFQFDFYIDADSPCRPSRELPAMGARYFVIPPYQKLPQHLSALTRLFRENRYQIVHSSMNTLSVFSLFAAWRAGVPVRICHNHSAGTGRGEAAKNLMKYALRPFAKVFATDYCACSQYAGAWLFGRRSMERGKVMILHNAIDLDKFRFDPRTRDEVRRELNLEGKFVVGHVGRFCAPKNHSFLIEIFAEVQKRTQGAVLLLAGDGELVGAVKEKAARLGLEEPARFLGIRSDVARLYQAMDVFVLPSLYEGLPVVGVEAQAAGLPCVFSGAVTREAELTDHVQFLPLNSGAEQWAEAILGCSGLDRGDVSEEIRRHGFDIALSAMELEKFYAGKTIS